MPVGRCVLSAGLIWTLSVSAALAQSHRPVVAVFDIEDKTSRFDQQAIRQLSDYLRARVAAGGAFQVVPSGQLKERLVEQKKESYKDCYDQQCQIEIGREVAAQKSLATQIVEVGGECALMTTLYDLKRATSDGSATEKSGCGQEALVGAVEKTVAALSRTLREPGEGSRSVKKEPGTLRLDGLPPGAEVLVDGVSRGRAPLHAALELPAGDHRVLVRASGHRPWKKQVIAFPGLTHREKVSLQAVATITVGTDPPGAAVFLDGERRGTTPVPLELDVGRRHALRLEQEGCTPIVEEVTVRGDTRLSYRLDPKPRRSRNEWFGAELFIGGTTGGAPTDDTTGSTEAGGLALGLNVRLFTLKWPFFYWSILNLAPGLVSRSTGQSFHTLVETEAGSQLHFGHRDQHQLRFGVGFGMSGELPHCPDNGCSYGVLHVSLAASYLYQTAGRFFFGAGIRMVVPVTHNLFADSGATATYPGVLFLATLPIGWASLH